MRKITLIIALFLTAWQSDAQVLLSENFDTALNWTVTHVNGTSTSAGWTRVTSCGNPTATPSAGAGMAQFDSYNIAAGNNYSLRSPGITFAGATYRIRFSMFRDNGYSDDLDKIRVFYSANTNPGGTLIGTIHRSVTQAPAEEQTGWHTYNFDLPAALNGTGYVSFMGTSAYGNSILIDEVSVMQIQNDDAEMAAIGLPSISTNQGNTDITGTLKNSGANAITSVDLMWQINDGTVHTQNVTGLDIAPGTTYAYTHADQWNATPGQYEIKVWAANPNGAPDADATNNELIKSLYIVNEIFPKTVVYEEATGTWCGWCVRGHIGLKDMAHYHEDDETWIGIAVHNADPMVLAEYDTAIGNYISGYPSGAINRVPSEVDPGLSSLQPAYNGELAKTPLGRVNIVSQSWNETTREISFDTQAMFALDIANADYNIAAVITEDGVVGTSNSWRQRNYYAGGTITDWEGINWGAYPDYIPAATMVYNHVGRALLGGFNGVEGSVPTAVAYNTGYNQTFNYTVPAAQNPENIKMVALLIDNTSGQIVNAKEVHLDTTLGTTAFNPAKLGVYPNPTTGIFNVYTDKPVNVSIVDMLGKVVFTVSNVGRETPINLAGLQKGVYLAKISGDDISATEKIILN